MRYRIGLQESLKSPLPLVGSFLVSQVYGTTAATLSREASATLKLHNKTYPLFFCHCNLSMLLCLTKLSSERLFWCCCTNNLWHYSLTCGLDFCPLLKMALFSDLPWDFWPLIKCLTFYLITKLLCKDSDIIIGKLVNSVMQKITWRRLYKFQVPLAMYRNGISLSRFFFSLLKKVLLWFPSEQQSNSYVPMGPILLCLQSYY